MKHEGIEHTGGLLEMQLASELSKMTLEEALTLARAFGHHLTLMGIAETQHRHCPIFVRFCALYAYGCPVLVLTVWGDQCEDTAQFLCSCVHCMLMGSCMKQLRDELSCLSAVHEFMS
ncbi:hypothetical protein VNO80_03108 [Phaseolus coccineus]|uniref:Uncharacterized protein n=1 Tax=Phaseolus coccineus TaxID=3886 RepID=A0AAN9NW66_PHACN